MAPVLQLQPDEGRGVSPGPGSKNREHKHRRRLIGPMPESALASEVPVSRQTPKKRRWFSPGSRVSATSQEDEDKRLRDVIKAHAYEFFKGHGGKDEDWGEEKERCVREEMLARWRQSEWGKWRSAKESGTVRSRWVGASFDIGTFLGVNVLDKAQLTTSPTSSPPGSPTTSTRAPLFGIGKQPSAMETFVTAPSKLSPRSPTRRDGLVSGTLSDFQNPSSYFTTVTPLEEQPATVLEEPLQGSSQVMDRLEAPDLVSVAQSNATAGHSVTPSQRKGKKKQVRYEDDVHIDEPAPPSNVLARSGQQVAKTSAGAVEAARVDITAEEGGILMRGLLRILLRQLLVTFLQIACWSVCLTQTPKALVQRLMRIKIGSLHICSMRIGQSLWLFGGRNDWSYTRIMQVDTSIF